MVSDIVITPCSQLCPLVFFLHTIVFPPPHSIRKQNTRSYRIWKTQHRLQLLWKKKSYLMLAVRSKPPSESFNGKNLNIKPLNNYTHLCQSTWKFKFWIFSITSFIVERRWLQVVWNSSSLFVNSGYDGSKIPSVHQFLRKLRQRGANLLQMTSSFCQPDNAWRCEQGVTL